MHTETHVRAKKLPQNHDCQKHKSPEMHPNVSIVCSHMFWFMCWLFSKEAYVTHSPSHQGVPLVWEMPFLCPQSTYPGNKHKYNLATAMVANTILSKLKQKTCTSWRTMGGPGKPGDPCSPFWPSFPYKAFKMTKYITYYVYKQAI